MYERTFSLKDQMIFAKLSGDWNPLHVDPVYARRCLTGQIVVHGVHATLWTLDSWLEGYGKSLRFRSLKVYFLKPIPLESAVTFSVIARSADHAVIEISCAKSVAARLEIEWEESARQSSNTLVAQLPERSFPRELSADEIEKSLGSLELYFESDVVSKLFPRLVKFVSPWEIAVILNTSRLVGGECPGLHSLYSELHLFSSDVFSSATLNYEVKKLDRRFGLVCMQVTAPGMTGTIKAFVRPRPQQQANHSMLQAQVKRGEFADQKALVVGGSRGLGELTAKILAAGGANVKITYFQGKDDAARVTQEITSSGGTADSLRYNVLEVEYDELTSTENWCLSHLYYFATPFISSGRKGVFSAELFEQFCGYYVTGLARILGKLKNSGLKYVFYPSTVFIDELPLDMAEYTAAKTAGETLCALLEKSHPGTTIFKPRLPRLATDQTVSLLPVNNQDPLPIMLGLLRSFRDLPGWPRHEMTEST